MLELHIGQDATLVHTCTNDHRILLETTSGRWWCPFCRRVFEITKVAERCYRFVEFWRRPIESFR